CFAFWPSFCLSRETFSGSLWSRFLRVSSLCQSSVVGLLSKRISLLLTSACFRSGPFAPRSLLASSLLWACPTPGRCPCRLCLPCQSSPFAPPGLPGSSADLSTRAAPFHPVGSGGCSCPLLHRRCWLHPIRQTGHPLFVSRGRFGFAFAAAHVFASRAFAFRIAPAHARLATC